MGLAAGDIINVAFGDIFFFRGPETGFRGTATKQAWVPRTGWEVCETGSGLGSQRLVFHDTGWLAGFLGGYYFYFLPAMRARKDT